jgi:hypothetical protein
MKGKFVADPASSGKGGLRTKGESASTKAALSHAKNAPKASSMGRKK